MIIAVDGPAASGKGTLAAGLARHFGLPHLDTGLLYRAVGKQWLPFEGQEEADVRAVALAQTLDPQTLDPAALGAPEVGQAASKVAAMPEVRAALLQLQRDFAHRPGGAVLDGRDIGTVICPEADVKIFLTAEAEIRAERRARQIEALGGSVDRAALLADIKTRDARDMGRAHAPLKPADDAHLLDTSQLDIEAALRAAIAIVERAIARKADR